MGVPKNSTDLNNNDSSVFRSLNIKTMNPSVKSFLALEYAGRGPVGQKTFQIDRELREGVPKSFKKLVRGHIGDAQAMGHRPITFLRQVLALVSLPELLNSNEFAPDAKEKAREILNSCRGGTVGSYSEPRGMELVRNHVAQYITQRDGGIASFPENIVICTGASDGIRAVLKLFKHKKGEKESGIMIPIPQFPMYRASLTEFDIHDIEYFLDESKNWDVTKEELTRAFNKAKKYCQPRALVVINPGNPTGNILERKSMEDIVMFCIEHNLVLLADEVYQENIFEGNEFLSFKKVMSEMNYPYNQLELISFYSVSKGYASECGLRGGYFEMVNIDQEVKNITIAASVSNLCPPVIGQVALDCLVDPPKPGDASYSRYSQEKNSFLNDLSKKGALVEKKLNVLPRISCSHLQGSMYAYPKVDMPVQAVQHAISMNLSPDVYYCVQLVDHTGISVVPGEGIGQASETYHFRLTLLPPMDTFEQMLDDLANFHIGFMKEHGGL